MTEPAQILAHASACRAKKPWNFSTRLCPETEPGWLAHLLLAHPAGSQARGKSVSFLDYGHTFAVNPPTILLHMLCSSLHCGAAGERTGWMFSQVEVSWECMAGAHLEHPSAHRLSVPGAKLHLPAIKTSWNAQQADVGSSTSAVSRSKSTPVEVLFLLM